MGRCSYCSNTMWDESRLLWMNAASKSGDSLLQSSLSQNCILSALRYWKILNPGTKNYPESELCNIWWRWNRHVSKVILAGWCSPSWELELRPLGVATGNASSVTRVWRYICKNTTCWPATAHDVTTGVSQYKCRREHTSSAFSSSLTGLFEETCILVGIQFSFIYHGEH